MRTLLLAFGLGGLAAVAAAAAQPAHPGATARPKPAPPASAAKNAAVPREGIEALEAQLDRAIDRVSLPRPVALLGRDSARGYRLPGYGIVFVLTPRTLPGPDGYDVLRPHHRVEFRRVRPHPPGEDDAGPDAVGALERQVIVLQQQTEQARRAAEEDMERIVHDVRVRHTAPGEMQVEVRTLDPAPLPPEAPAPAAAPEAPRSPETPRAPEAPRVSQPPAPAEAPLPPPPPWKFWFDAAVSHDTRTPEAVVADVRQVLVEVLESSPGRVSGLGPEEFVTVAVDFEPAGLFAQRARPERTLVVRARVRDLEARAKGAIAADDLRRRVEVIEY
jgi:hypothetical protein